MTKNLRLVFLMSFFFFGVEGSFDVRAMEIDEHIADLPHTANDNSWDASQGEYKNTQNWLDVLIDGDGFFQVDFGDGTIAYMRAGEFQMNPYSNITTKMGYALHPLLTLPEQTTNISIDKQGVIEVIASGKHVPSGQIQLALFADPSKLEAIGNNMFRPTTESGAAVLGLPDTGDRGILRQGWVQKFNTSCRNKYY